MRVQWGDLALVKIDFTKVRILIVDDNASVRTILQALLSFSGAPQADEAADGETARAPVIVPVNVCV